MANTSNTEVAVEFTENLAASVDTEMSEQDIFQTTKLLDAVSNANPSNSSGAKSIIQVFMFFDFALYILVLLIVV